ncbi:MAG: type II toxin-antitoxin system RelB/DinJ family antitoxin [Verrucomicrobia bacterium]|nr:type II toxin-antitoxin system RelB/DinJ family antitoxin [Verrucomicrobiota bacterium]
MFPCPVAHPCYIGLMKEAIVRARVDSRLKADAEAVFGTLGINTTEAIRMFLSQVRLRRGLPFIVGIPDNADLLLPTQVRQDAIDSLYED